MESTASGVRAFYYDGRLARPHEVELSLPQGRVLVSGAAVTRDEPRESVLITEPVGYASRFLYFHDGAYGEVSDRESLNRLLSADGQRHRLYELERSPWKALAALAVVAATVAFAYFYGLPRAAGAIADALPESTVDTLSRQTLRSLDGRLLRRSEYTAFRQNQIVEEFNRLRLPGDTAGRIHLVFRKSELIGANAFALPSGTVVVTDALIDLVKRDDELMGVLVHEAGHVAGRHGLRQVVRGSIVAGAVTWYIGDVSVLAAAAPTALLRARYSRELEREADDYAAARLSANGISPAALADILERLEHAAKTRTGRVGPMFSYLSTHPATSERLATLRH